MRLADIICNPVRCQYRTGLSYLRPMRSYAIIVWYACLKI